MSYGQNIGTDNSDWESSFSQILNRTKHNLNRINQRYAPPTESSILASRGFVNNENAINQQSLLLDKFNKPDTFLQQQQQRPVLESKSSSGDLNASAMLMERLARLEEQQRATESSSAFRISTMEKNLESALKAVDRSAQETKDLNHNILQLQGKISTLNGFVEMLQADNDSKRNVISKMDSWIRQVSSQRHFCFVFFDNSRISVTFFELFLFVSIK